MVHLSQPSTTTVSNNERMHMQDMKHEQANKQKFKDWAKQNDRHESIESGH